ncbi:MAG: peptidoglycan-associated lipoprotein Pal [Gammaproteobacteria bacterium]
MNNEQLKIPAAIFGIALLAGCASTEEEALEEVPVINTIEAPATTGLGTGDDNLQLNPLDDPDNMLATRVIYFEYDSDEVRSEFVNVVAAHAGFLSGNPNAQLRLEGHADERGSREYNLGLGERRAQSVRNIIRLNGGNTSQLEIISYGEESPASEGSNESAWQQNRRVELVYSAQ